MVTQPPDTDGQPDWGAVLRNPVAEGPRARHWARRAGASLRAPAGLPYRRAVQSGGGDLEVMLARWAARRSWPHDHDRAHGLVLVVEGVVYERRWARGDEGCWRPGPERRFTVGMGIEVAPGVFHDMRGSEGALTLHLYRPGIESMQLLDVARREIVRVSGSVGAWAPGGAGQRTPWSAA